MVCHAVANPSAPGMKCNTLLALIRKGQITPRSVVRGPTTFQLWRFAARVKGSAGNLVCAIRAALNCSGLPLFVRDVHVRRSFRRTRTVFWRTNRRRPRRFIARSIRGRKPRSRFGRINFKLHPRQTPAVEPIPIARPGRLRRFPRPPKRWPNWRKFPRRTKHRGNAIPAEAAAPGGCSHTQGTRGRF